MIQNDLIADYDAFSIILRKRMSHGVQADAHYTWSRTRDMATHSNGGGQTMDNYDIWRDYGPANWDIPHRFVASYLYDLPFLKDSSNADPEVRRRGLAGVGRDDDPERIAGQHHASPRTARTSASPVFSGPTSSARVPDLNCQPNSAGATDVARRQLINCFDAVAFALPAQFTFGNASRNILRGPKFSSTDLSFMKTVPVGGAGAVPDPRRDVQHLQPGQLRQPERVVRFGRVRHASPPPGRCGRCSSEESTVLF